LEAVILVVVVVVVTAANDESCSVFFVVVGKTVFVVPPFSAIMLLLLLPLAAAVAFFRFSAAVGTKAMVVPDFPSVWRNWDLLLLLLLLLLPPLFALAFCACRGGANRGARTALLLGFESFFPVSPSPLLEASPDVVGFGFLADGKSPNNPPYIMMELVLLDNRPQKTPEPPVSVSTIVCLRQTVVDFDAMMLSLY
jgi:hypothetical protein